MPSFSKQYFLGPLCISLIVLVLLLACTRNSHDTGEDGSAIANENLVEIKLRPSPVQKNILRYISHKRAYARLYLDQDISGPIVDFIRGGELLKLLAVGNSYKDESRWYFVEYKNKKGWLVLHDPLFYYHSHEHRHLSKK